MNRRVVVTGLGIVTPMGVGLEKSWSAGREGRSGINRITRFDPSPFKTQVAGEVLDFDPALFLDVKERKRYDLFV